MPSDSMTTADLDQLVSASQRAHDAEAEAGFVDGNGVDVRPPMRIEYRFGARRGRLVVVFHDGDAYVRFDGDPGDTLVKWCHLCAVPDWIEEIERNATIAEYPQPDPRPRGAAGEG